MVYMRCDPQGKPNSAHQLIKNYTNYENMDHETIQSDETRTLYTLQKT